MVKSALKMYSHCVHVVNVTNKSYFIANINRRPDLTITSKQSNTKPIYYVGICISCNMVERSNTSVKNARFGLYFELYLYTFGRPQIVGREGKEEDEYFVLFIIVLTLKTVLSHHRWKTTLITGFWSFVLNNNL